MAVTLAVYVVGKVSGGHINPAITIAECVFGNFPWAHAPHYIISQVRPKGPSEMMSVIRLLEVSSALLWYGLFILIWRKQTTLLEFLLLTQDLKFQCGKVRKGIKCIN